MAESDRGRPKLPTGRLRQPLCTVYTSRLERDLIHAAYSQQPGGLVFAAWMRRLVVERSRDLLKKRKQA